MNKIFPLSINQREIYIDQMMWAGGSHLNIGATVTVDGVFDVEIFNYAMNKVILCHPGLRARIYESSGTPLQKVAPHQDAPIKLVDFFGDAQGEEKANLYISQEFKKPFTFGENFPLVDFQLIRISPQKHIIFGKYHHGIIDGWGTAIFFRELVKTYNQRIQNGADNQTERDWAISEYLESESKYLKSSNLARDRDYWLSRLQGVSTQVFPKIKPQELIGNRQAIYISREKYNRVNALCENIQSNAFHLILSLITIALTKRYGKDDLVVGLSLLNRNKKSLKDSMGLYVSTIPFRVQINGEQTVHQLLDEIRSDLRQDYRHQRFPLGEMKRLPGLKSVDKKHLFEVFLSYERHDYNESFLDTQTTCVPLYSGQQKIPLIVYVREYNEQSDIKIDFDYNLSYLDEQTVTQIITNFKTLFDRASENIEATISSLSISTSTTKSFPNKPKILQSYTTDETLVSLFENSVSKYPENAAVQFNKKTLTYAQLDAKANRLAHYLIKQKVKPGTRVGICLERSENIVVAILGILKTGAAYVSLDPSSPPERLQLILQDSGISALLSEESNLSQLTSKEVAVFTFTSLEKKLTQQPSTSPQIDLKPEFPAYIIYTSGSTGTPKGCIVNHRNTVRLLRSTEAWFGFNERDIWTLFHSFAFDFSVWELWGALLYGGKVIIVPFWLSRSPETFREFLSTEGVTVLNQTPSAFYQLIRADEASVSELGLRYVIFGGEALHLQSLSPWLERYGDKTPRLINMYGITETTVHVTYRPISRSDLTASANVIGTEIPDIGIYLLDEKLEPVADGLPGEIYVAGAGVTNGYLNRPSLTAQRFLPNPFGEGRFYRSGDLGRRLPNGDLEYLGRVDRQVKIRGFRIELGEIQTALTSHSQVREAVIVTQEYSTENRLVAYYVPGDINPTANELRVHLKNKLPEYMIPAAYVSLDAFPLNINGKIDTKALPAPDWNLLLVSDEYIAPRNPSEEKLCGIVAEVLGIERVGIDDNFFEIGGDSILALQVIAQAKKAGFAISTRDLYESSTVRDLAVDRVVLATKNESNYTNISLLSDGDRQRLPTEAEDAYPLSSLQAGMLYHNEMHVNSAIFHQIFSFDLRLSYSEVAWKKAIADICQANPVLRTSFHAQGYSIPIQIVNREVKLPLTVVDLRHLDGNNAREVVAKWIASEKTRSFDVSKAPLLRFQIHRISDAQITISFSFHHVILDGWSVATLLTQLLQRYVQYLESATVSELTVADISYKDFIVQEQQAISDKHLQSFWQQHLNNLEVTTLPRLKAVASDDESQRQLQRLSINIDSQLANSISTLAKSVGVPLKTALLAVHLRVLSFITGEKEVVTGNVINGRLETLDSQNLLGLFVNTVPFRQSLTSGTWLELIQDVFSHEKEIIPYRHFPLAQMQRLIEKRPLFEVGFNYVHFHVYQGLLNLEQVSVENVDIFEETDFSFLVEFCLVPGSTALELNLIYDRQQFTALQVEQYGKYYQAALNDIALHPQAQYYRRSLLEEQERMHLLQSANINRGSYVSEETIVSAFAQSVAEYSNKIALCFQETTLTFAELETYSNRLVHYLQNQGVKPGSFVGLCLERSEQLVITILAILKAGAAYVPIDPSSPRERIEFILQDSGVVLLLTQRSVVGHISDCDAQIVVLEDIAAQLENQSVESVKMQILPNQPAYIIYTSGSTGKPKGCVVTHSNVIRLLKASEFGFGFNSEDVWTLFHSYAFDFSVWEIWGALLYGGQVVVVPYEVSRSPSCFLELLQKQKVTVLNQTPSAFKQLIQVATPKAEKFDLRYVIFGGEALELSSLKPWFETYGDRQPQLINMYGITETTVHVTYRPITFADVTESQGSVIGQPLKDLNLYILDENLSPTPFGTPGEIYIGGAGVTQGYLHQPYLSAERFIPDPFAETGGSRLYRSGDLARRLPDGEIEYLGRSDRQVKIRGFRIETGEIAAVARSHPQVKDAFICVRQAPNGDNRLVAYVVCNNQDDILSFLPQFLKSKLPDYMIPATFVAVGAINLTVNGKVDQKALPEPDWNPKNQSYIAPRNERETAICSLVANLLQIERVGATDDFFEIGGDSLQVTQLAIRLRQTYQIEFPLPELFIHRTPEAIAQFIESCSTVETTMGIPKAQRKRRSVNLTDDGVLVQGNEK